MKLQKGDKVKVASRSLLTRTKLSLVEASPAEIHSLKGLFLYLGSILNDVPLKGVVIGYGARREDKPGEQYIGVKLYNKFGSLKLPVYFGEEELKKVKR